MTLSLLVVEILLGTVSDLSPSRQLQSSVIWIGRSRQARRATDGYQGYLGYQSHMSSIEKIH